MSVKHVVIKASIKMCLRTYHKYISTKRMRRFYRKLKVYAFVLVVTFYWSVILKGNGARAEYIEYLNYK